MAELDQLRRSVARQVDHWTGAGLRLGHLDNLASPDAWHRLERYLGVSIRDHLRRVIAQLNRRGDALRACLMAAVSASELAEARRLLLAFRRQYLRAEITVDFYTDAINTRSNPTVGGFLRACDILAHRSIATIVEPLGREPPVVLTYLDKGLGASILKAGLRLWDGGGPSVAAAIKVVRHTVAPTSLVHEAGHQVAHILEWNEELARTLADGLGRSAAVAELWAGWASEIAADSVAFVHTGFGSVLMLHDVLAGDPAFVFQVLSGDPHPMCYLRILLGIEMCRLAWGSGPWDELGETWRTLYPPESAPGASRAAIAASIPLLPVVARLTLATRMRAFRDRPFTDVISPARVSPAALAELEQKLGPALYTSSHWIWTECLRLLGLTALKPEVQAGAAAAAAPVNRWMLKLGGLLQAA
ncbi:MAG: hypothetical protein ABI647_10340 [Gemmatimonadota bacterium]